MPDIFVAKDKIKQKSKEVASKKDSPTKVALNKKEKKLPTQKKTSKHKLPGHTHNPLASFSYYPVKTSFVNKDPKEKIVLLLRKHPITNLGWIAVAFLMLIAPAFVSVFGFFETLPMRFQAIFLIFWYLLTSAFVFEEFLTWFFHVNIVTDERIIEVDFINLIYREITDANIDQIQDVTVEIGGASRTFYNPT